MKAKINRKLIIVFFLIAISVMLAPAHLSRAKKKEDLTIVYFYINVCKSCNETENSLTELSSIIKNTREDLNPVVKMYDIENSKGYQLLLKYLEYYKVPDNEGILPILFVGDKYFYGKEAIERGLKDLISSNARVISTPLLDLSVENSSSIARKFSKINGLNVFFTGLVNGFNPCSISMILFFLSVLISRKRKIISVGLAFCIGKFIMYLALGTVMFNLLSTIDIKLYGTVIKIIMGAVITVIVCLNLRDYFAARKEQYENIRMQLPKPLRKRNHSWIKWLSTLKSEPIIILFSFIMGALIAIGEFLCTGQLYLTTIVYILQNNPEMNLKAFTYLFLYDAAFILPLLTIVFFIGKGREIFDVSELFREKLALIKLITAIVFLILGIVIIFLF